MASASAARARVRFVVRMGAPILIKMASGYKISKKRGKVKCSGAIQENFYS
jgi:hypothetical protein